MNQEEKKFDFQNIDVKLYLALKTLLPVARDLMDKASFDADQPEVVAAELAMEEFELSHGGLPDWAIARNWDYSLVPGAQLCTKDGRRTGNAHIIKLTLVHVPETANRHNPYGEHTVYECLTDAGSKFVFTEPELLEAFTIGDWISDPVRILKDFDRNGEFTDDPV